MRQELITMDVPGVGKAAVVLPVAEPDWTPEMVELLEARKRAYLNGRCDECGATMTIPSRAERRAVKRDGTVLQSTWYHEDDCRFTDERAADLGRQWRAGKN